MPAGSDVTSSELPTWQASRRAAMKRSSAPAARSRASVGVSTTKETQSAVTCSRMWPAESAATARAT
jgi:hypothetical protein